MGRRENGVKWQEKSGRPETCKGGDMGKRRSGSTQRMKKYGIGRGIMGTTQSLWHEGGCGFVNVITP